MSLLKTLGIPSILIEAIIISHCHADHDAGTFQKILDAGRIEIITTKTILNSFMRKYSALADMDETFLRGLFVFRPVTIGANMNILGGKFKFFYSIHPIPCIGFEVCYEDKALYFSGDTFYNPIE
jgi:metal-dependent hydrolase (beta-lactamase superfamily II)